MAKSILTVDDDPHIREVVTFALQQAGYNTAEASDGRDAIARFKESQADMAILDINMPEMDGFDVCREIRKSSNIPILFLSSRDEEFDRVLGLELGADDYISKPFSPRELVARVKSIFRRCDATTQADTPNAQSKHITLGNLVIKTDKHQISWKNTAVSLTATEFRIVQAMAKHAGRVFDRDQIMNMAYQDNIHVSDRTVDSHVRHIRSKFAEIGCENLIETVHGVGYKISDTDND